MKRQFDLFKNNNISEKYSMEATALQNSFKSWLENKSSEWLSEYYDINQVAPYFIGDAAGLQSTCDLSDLPEIIELLSITYKEAHVRIKSSEISAKILFYMDEIGSGSDIEAIRRLTHSSEMPFSEEELKDFKTERENHFRKFLREQRGFKNKM